MRLSLYTLLTSELSLGDSLALAAEIGYDAVDLRQGSSDADAVHLRRDLTDAQAAEVRAQVEAVGLVVSGLTTYYRLGAADPAMAAVELSGLRRGLELAQLLGAPLVRCSGPIADWNQPYEQSREAFRRQAEEVTESAAAAGTAVAVEQHGGTHFSSAGQIVDMLRGLESPWLGLVFDPGNCIREGFERVAVQLDMLGPFIRCVHVKNMMTLAAEGPSEYMPYETRRLDQGLWDWAEIVRRLSTMGYAGYLTLEDFYAGFADLREKLTWDLQYLRGLLASAEA